MRDSSQIHTRSSSMQDRAALETHIDRCLDTAIEFPLEIPTLRMHIDPEDVDYVLQRYRDRSWLVTRNHGGDVYAIFDHPERRR